MRASYQWLKQLSGVDVSVDELATKLTDIGLEVESIERFDAPDRVLVAEVRAKRKHPERDNLTLVRVFDGRTEHEIICGAPNVPEPGGRVLFAQLGAKVLLDGSTVEISERKIAGVVSRGMLCSESELGIGAGGDGIFVFGADAPDAGTPLGDALPVGDAALVIGLTPNRPDCLGHLGLAREICAAYGKTLPAPHFRGPAAYAEGVAAALGDGPDRFPLPFPNKGVEVALDDVRALGPLGVHIADPERCPRYGAAMVVGVTVKPSPFWLRYRLHVLGLRSLGNLVDATNYVMLERGHPIHGFDLLKLRGRRIDVRLARDGETMTTLDGVERAMTADDLLICDGEGPVAIAGVMGGGNSEIDGSTKNVVIECAYFDPRSVRRTARRLGMHTDASHRFERGVDPGAVRDVLARAAALMVELGGGVALLEGIDVHPHPIARREVHLRRAALDALLGLEVAADIPPRILGAIGCAVSEHRDGWMVVCPTWRPDLGREADLIEEVARVHGYSHIPTRVPRVAPSRAGTPARVLFERRAREAAAALGLHEVVSYSFVAQSDLERARVATKSVPLANPLTEERSVMRTSLLPGLCAAASVSLRRQVPEIALFELGTVFEPTDGVLPREHAMLGALLAGRTRAWLGDERALDLYDAKGFVEAICMLLVGVAPETVHGGLVPSLHPRRQALLRVDGRSVGVLGELHPDVADALELGVRAIYAELDVEGLLEVRDARVVARATPPPRFPSVTRDMALLVEERHEAVAVAAALEAGAGPLLESIGLFDLYRGTGVPEGCKSLAFRLVYRDPGATLTDRAVDQAHAAAAESAKRLLGAVVR